LRLVRGCAKALAGLALPRWLIPERWPVLLHAADARQVVPLLVGLPDGGSFEGDSLNFSSN
jgi:hypothetical protein